ncbi:MAG: GyrI-like domain-containing protein, partial [Desulfuromonadaceae bacterium]|nr:GyrI-like domain-containing protein [Desulfuromonadaceae bacterium]
RSNNRAAVYLYETWLPQSGEALGDLPMIFHYVNVGPNVKEEEMITDVYLPLKEQSETSDLENGNLKR